MRFSELYRHARAGDQEEEGGALRVPENLGPKKAHIISIQGPLGVLVYVSSCLFSRVSSYVSDSLCISINIYKYRINSFMFPCMCPGSLRAVAVLLHQGKSPAVYVKL